MFTTDRQVAEDYARAHGHVILYQITDRDTERVTYVTVSITDVTRWLEDWDVLDDYRDRVNRAAARALGSIRTPHKSATSAANVAVARAARTVRDCTCGQDPHKYNCPCYARDAQRRSRERQKKAY